MKFHRRASPLVVLSLIIIFALLAVLLLPLQKSRPPADLTFTLLDGRTLSLAELRGRPVLIAFWATSCAPCVEELPDLMRLYRELQPRGFELVAVAMPYDPPLQVQAFAQQHSVPYPIALDVMGKAAQAFGGVDFIPTAFLLNPAGDVVLRHTGKLDIAQTRPAIESLLKSVPSSSRVAFDISMRCQTSGSLWIRSRTPSRAPCLPARPNRRGASRYRAAHAWPSCFGLPRFPIATSFCALSIRLPT
jgi:peroxiredoxin